MEADQLLPQFFGLGLLLLLSGLFSGSETALCALNKVQVERLRSENKKTSAAIVRFVEDSRRLFITVLLGNIFINTAFAAIAYSLIRSLPISNLSGIAEFVIATVVITLPLLLFGEIIPKTYAIRYAEGFARVTARPLWGFSVVIAPFRAMLRQITGFLLPLFGGNHTQPEKRVTAADVRAIVNARQTGLLEADEQEILSNVLELREIEAKEIMVPRTAMVALETSTTIQEAISCAKVQGFSRIPIYRKSIDDICGVFHVKDLPFWKDTAVRELTIEDFMTQRHILMPTIGRRGSGGGETLIRPPLFVLETKKLADVYAELAQQKQKMAILIDEYGGVSGLVTTEDIIEEVVGDIFDEHDRRTSLPEMIVRSEQPLVVEIHGRTSVRELNQKFGLHIDEENSDTIGGYVLDLFGRIPAVNEAITDANGVRFEIAAIVGNQIGAVIMTLPHTPAEGVTAPNGTDLKAIALLFASIVLMGVAAPSPLLLHIVALSLGVVVFLVLSAFFSGAETALVSLDMVRFEQMATNAKAVEIIKRLLASPDRMLGLTLLGTNVANVVTSQMGVLFIGTVVAASMSMQQIMGTLHINETALATVIITGLTLVFGELLPKTIFRLKPETLALRYAYVLRVAEVVLNPVVRLLSLPTRFFVGAREEDTVSSQARREELRLLATMGEQSGGLLSDERRMIHGVLELHERTVEQVMVPLVDIVAVEKGTTMESFLQIACESGFSRLPVYQQQIFNIVGIVNLLDVIYANGRAKTVEPLIRTNVQFVPEAKGISILLKEMQRGQQTMVFVVDEYGGIVGLVTIEDLIEEIVGEFADERDETPSVRFISPRLLECDGRTELDTLRDRFGVALPPGDYETVAGYILEVTGSIPKPGERVELDNLTLTIVDADPRAIRRVRIRNKVGHFAKSSGVREGGAERRTG